MQTVITGVNFDQPCEIRGFAIDALISPNMGVKFEKKNDKNKICALFFFFYFFLFHQKTHKAGIKPG